MYYQQCKDLIGGNKMIKIVKINCYKLKYNKEGIPIFFKYSKIFSGMSRGEGEEEGQ